MFHFQSFCCPSAPKRRYYWKSYTTPKKSVHEKRGTHAVTRSTLEAFELARFAETSNEDPTPSIYNNTHTPYLYIIKV